MCPRRTGIRRGAWGDGEIDPQHHAPVVTPEVAGIVPKPTNDIRDVLVGTATWSRISGSPTIIALPETILTDLGTWYDVLPPTLYNFPADRLGDSVLLVAIQLHLLWDAGPNAQALCDWMVDRGNHFARTFHGNLTKQDPSSINGVDPHIAAMTGRSL